MPRAIPAMQIVHLVLLFLVAPLWFLVRQTSEPDDVFARTVSSVIGIAGIAWVSLLIVLAIRYGNKEEGTKRLFAHYRHLLASFEFLVVSDVVLIVGVSVLTHQTVAYRQVEFRAPVGGRLVVSDTPGSPEVLARLDPNAAKRVRLRIGTRHVAFQMEHSVMALPPIDVLPWWCDATMPAVDINAKDEPYESVR